MQWGILNCILEQKQDISGKAAGICLKSVVWLTVMCQCSFLSLDKHIIVV